jgi:transaldolase
VVAAGRDADLFTHDLVGQAVLDQLAEAGIDLVEVFQKLESEGVSKFAASWDELVASVATAQGRRE